MSAYTSTAPAGTAWSTLAALGPSTALMAPLEPLLAASDIGGVSAHLQAGLASVGYAQVSGPAVMTSLAISNVELASFSAFWRGLTPDRFMADGGAYRLRRYGAFELHRPGGLHALEHAPYEQSRDVNPLNGGVQREFDPLEPGFARHAVLEKLLLRLADVYDAVEGQRVHWNIRLHPYRIRADLSEPGLPTPEGLHRDGVDYIATLMVQRHNVEGGETLVTDESHFPLWRKTLLDPMEILVANDHRTRHSVTAVVARNPLQTAYRDVLVVAFTRV